MQEQTPTEIEVSKNSKQSSIFLIFKIFGLLFLFSLIFLIGNYFPVVDRSKMGSTKPIERQQQEGQQDSVDESVVVSSALEHVSVEGLQEAVAQQQYPRYAVIDNRELVLVSFNGGQEIRPGVPEPQFGGGHSGYGSTDPSTAPDFKKVAYIDNDRKLHIMNSKGDVDLLVSDNLEVDYISGWSSDSEKLIFYVRSNTIYNSLNPDGMMFELPETEKYDSHNNPNGFYLFDLSNGTLSYLSVMENSTFESWIDSERILVNVNQYGTEKFVIFNTKTYEADFTLIGGELEKDFGTQHSFSKDGSKWALTWHGGDGGTNSASIIYADFPSVSGKELLKADFAQIQGPVISPDGKQVAFRGYDVVNGPLYTYLYDGNTVEKVIDGFPKAWVSNTEFIVMLTTPTHATNPNMASKLYLYNTVDGTATQIFSYTEN